MIFSSPNSSFFLLLPPPLCTSFPLFYSCFPCDPFTELCFLSFFPFFSFFSFLTKISQLSLPPFLLSKTCLFLFFFSSFFFTLTSFVYFFFYLASLPLSSNCFLFNCSSSHISSLHPLILVSCLIFHRINNTYSSLLCSSS